MKKPPTQTQARVPGSRAGQRDTLRRLAQSTGKSMEELIALEDALRVVPIERFLEGCFGPDHGAFYDAGEDLWIVPDPKHRGPGFGFIAIRNDRSWFSGVVPEEAFQ